jgi:ribosomal protein L19
MNVISELENKQVEKLAAEGKLPTFAPGDTLRVNVKVIEGTRERIQAFEGVCIGRKNAGLNSAFTVRKLSYGEGVERVFPLYSAATSAGPSSTTCVAVPVRRRVSPSRPTASRPSSPPMNGARPKRKSRTPRRLRKRRRKPPLKRPPKVDVIRHRDRPPGRRAAPREELGHVQATYVV